MHQLSSNHCLSNKVAGHANLNFERQFKELINRLDKTHRQGDIKEKK